MGLHREGYSVILVFFLIIGAIVSLLHYLIPFEGIGKIALLILDTAAIIFWGLVIYFFRYPKFDVEINENHILSPADGKIVVIEKTVETEYFNEERIQVSVFMSPLNTHMNRYPMSGKIAYHKYHKGKFLVAWDPKSSTDNERNTLVFENDKTNLLVRQIAGAVARRIRWYGKPEDKIVQGEQLGFIKFGSRLDLFLPLDAKINVEMDEVVYAGKTIIAKID